MTDRFTSARRSAKHDRPPARQAAPYLGTGRRAVLVPWYASIVIGGFVFGMLAERRPFGESVFAHPLVMFFILVGLGLLGLRVLMARPVPEVLSDRALAVGCVLGLFMFLAGNFAAIRFQFLG